MTQTYPSELKVEFKSGGEFYEFVLYPDTKQIEIYNNTTYDILSFNADELPNLIIALKSLNELYRKRNED